MKISQDSKLMADEVSELRKSVGWSSNTAEWEECLKQNLLNVSARNEEGIVVGAGFLCGNQRHAELVDLVVHPNYQKQGIGREITKQLVNYALQKEIKYIGLNFNEDSPWLKKFYESVGFVMIQNAMWHRSSLENL